MKTQIPVPCFNNDLKKQFQVRFIKIRMAFLQNTGFMHNFYKLDRGGQ